MGSDVPDNVRVGNDLRKVFESLQGGFRVIKRHRARLAFFSRQLFDVDFNGGSHFFSPVERAVDAACLDILIGLGQAASMIRRSSGVFSSSATTGSLMTMVMAPGVARNSTSSPAFRRAGRRTLSGTTS